MLSTPIIGLGLKAPQDGRCDEIWEETEGFIFVLVIDFCFVFSNLFVCFNLGHSPDEDKELIMELSYKNDKKRGYIYTYI